MSTISMPTDLARMRVMFAPDWRRGVPYQMLLSTALERSGVTVEWLSEYRRGLPLWRSISKRRCDLFHLHWPEAYYGSKQDGFDWFRLARFQVDLGLTTLRLPMVLTAHNLLAHNRQEEPFSRANAEGAMRLASGVIAHCDAAKAAILGEFDIAQDKIHVIPMGDLAAGQPAPMEVAEARKALGIGEEPICLVFGTVEPYKGIEELIRIWRSRRFDAALVIVGKPGSERYGSKIKRLVADCDRVRVVLGWLADESLRLWLSAANCVAFNYRSIFTSGAAGFARSLGIPLLIPTRCRTVDLDEPDARVFRFNEDDFEEQLTRALNVPPSYGSAAAWRERRSWNHVAAMTAAVYRGVLQEADGLRPS